ncbi:hypothetical protein TYRP_015188 [Tyrophagus putrescentiae]|nr:hypothetical protein TYRP_015188 [Tyrophagus putrescentiae]
MESRHTLKLLLLGLFDVASLPRRFTLSSYRNSFSRQQQRGDYCSVRWSSSHSVLILSFFPFLIAFFRAQLPSGPLVGTSDQKTDPRSSSNIDHHHCRHHHHHPVLTGEIVKVKKKKKKEKKKR